MWYCRARRRRTPRVGVRQSFVDDRAREAGRGAIKAARPVGGRAWPSTARRAADGTAPSFPRVVINEALTHTDLPEIDTIELYNPTASPAAVGGWFLTDDHTQPANYRIPMDTVIPPGGYVTFDESQFNVGSTLSPSVPWARRFTVLR